MPVTQTELVPMLRAELSEELSIEQRIVNASLKCVCVCVCVCVYARGRACMCV